MGNDRWGQGQVVPEESAGGAVILLHGIRLAAAKPFVGDQVEVAIRPEAQTLGVHGLTTLGERGPGGDARREDSPGLACGRERGPAPPVEAEDVAPAGPGLAPVRD